MKIKKPARQYKIFEYLDLFESFIYSKLPFLIITKKYSFYGSLDEFESLLGRPNKFYVISYYKNQFSITAKYSIGVLQTDEGDYVDRINIEGNYKSVKNDKIEIEIKLTPSSTAILSIFAGVPLVIFGIYKSINFLIIIGFIIPIIPIGINYLQRNSLIQEFINACKLTVDKKNSG